MEYRKVGRGGAGNYYSEQDIQDASRRLSEQRDIEAQKPDAPSASLEGTTEAQYASSGRGGAGNVTDKAKITASTKETMDTTPALQETNAASEGHWGRGGAGNYRTNVLGPSRPAEREMEDWKRDDVEMGLKAPEQAHLGSEKLSNDTLE